MTTLFRPMAGLALWTAAAAGLGIAPLQPAFAQPGLARLGPAKATVDAAKAQGAAGEQADGFVGMVAGGAEPGRGAEPGLRAAVDEINAGRAQAYRAAAERTGVSPQTAAAATARQLEGRLPPGQYFRSADGRWERR